MNTYVELNYPEIVKDVQSIFWSCIDPITKVLPGNSTNSVFIDKVKPEHEPLRKIFKKYNFLAHHLLVIRLDPNYSTPIHLDGKDAGLQRPISLNIPISGCNVDCVTEFYNIPNDQFWSDNVTNTRFLKNGVTGEKIAEYRLTTNPIMTCPQTPHRVNNIAGTQERITVSWTFAIDLTFESQLARFAQENKLL